MEQFKDLPIGIDLGTTFSCIGVYRNSSVEIIPNEKGDRVTPSVVSFLDDDIYVGEQSEYKTLKDPKNKIYGVKRIIGRNFNDNEVQNDLNKFTYTIEDDNGRPKIVVDSNGIKKYSPEQISAKILNKLKKSAEEFLQRPIKKVVITVPAYFTERQKRATKNAGEIAGLEVIKIINEPTASAIAYGFGRCQNYENNTLGKKIDFHSYNAISYRTKNSEIDETDINSLLKDYNSSNPYQKKKTEEINDKKETENILVFDLGGGTLDVTLLELEKDDITVKAHSGIMHLGGEDFDNILVDYCIEEFKKRTRIDLNTEEYIKQKLRLKRHCENAKKELSYKLETEIEVESIVNGKDLNLKLTRARFEELCKNIFHLCINPIKEVLETSHESKENIDEILLVGGSTRIPYIQQMLKEFFNEKELNTKLNPDESVAYGATIEAAICMGNYCEDVTLSDVCPFSLGVAIEKKEYYQKNGLYMRKIIEKGSNLPCRTSQIFNPAHDNSDFLVIQIYEGDNKFVKDNFPLGKFKLLNIPKKKKEEINIEVTFELDEDSILTVTAVIKENNCTNSIVIKNDKGGLSKNEIEEAKKNQNLETSSNDNLGPAMVFDRNYKNEINEFVKSINNTTDALDQLYYLQKLKTSIEKYIETFNSNIPDNDTLIEKMYHNLIRLFTTYSLILKYDVYLNDEEKDFIFLKGIEYLKFFEKKGTSYLPSLVKIFYYNDDKIFGEYCVQILEYFSQKGTELYSSNEKKYSKHYLEETLAFIKKYEVYEKVKNDELLTERLNSIIFNCNELINILKAEKIEKYCKSFSKHNLIDENEFDTNEEQLNILDRFKEALRFIPNPDTRDDKLLKAIYLANIVKIEYKIFKSNNYDTLLKMIENSIELKLQVPKSCITTDLRWFDEICKYKNEIEAIIENKKENPKDQDNKLKEGLKEVIEKINDKYKESKINFLFYILSDHKPNGLDSNYIFDNSESLEIAYNSNPKHFMKNLRKLYNPMRYKGDKEEEQKIHLIMQEISILLNNIK